MTSDLDPDILAHATVVLVSMPDDRRAPETEALADVLRIGMDMSRAAGATDCEMQDEARTLAAMQRRMLTTAYARGA